MTLEVVEAVNDEYWDDEYNRLDERWRKLYDLTKDIGEIDFRYKGAVVHRWKTINKVLESFPHWTGTASPQHVISLGDCLKDYLSGAARWQVPIGTFRCGPLAFEVMKLLCKDEFDLRYDEALPTNVVEGYI